MDIQYFTDIRLFKLDTHHTTYAMELMGNGILNHVYWGTKLDRVEDVPTGDETRREVIDAFIGNRDETIQEYMPWGGYYFEENTLKVTFHDGVRDVRLRYQSHAIIQEAGKGILSIILADVYYPLQVELFFEIFNDSDIIDKYCIITNKGSEIITLEKAFSAMWRLPYQKQYHLTHLAGQWGREYSIERLLLTQASTVLETRTGTSGNNACPLFMVDDGRADEQWGDVFFGSVQWSGNWKIVVEKTRFGHLQVSGGINDFDFSWAMKGGEVFETPRFSGGLSREGFGGVSRMLHNYQRQHLMSKQNANRIMPIIYNSWGTFEFDINEQRMIELAKLAAQAGTELFVIDDGWFGSNRHDTSSGVGDWIPSKEKFPNGLNPLIQAVNDSGMDFGIWVEPEMVNPDSNLYREHPDWVLHYPTRESNLGRNTLVLNLAREDVCEYIYKQIDWLLGNHNIHYLKIDHNRFITEPGWPSVPVEDQKTVWVKYVFNFYSILDRICTKHPDVIIENCAGGGARVDLAMTRYSVRVNRSDNQDTLDILKLHEGFTYLMMARAAGGGCHISQKFTFAMNKRKTNMRYQAHVAMMGSLAIGDNLFEYTAEDMAELKVYTDLYKVIRETVHLGDLYRLVSPRYNPIAANLFVRKDQSQAVLFVFGQSIQFRQVLPRIKVPGLDPDTVYYIEGYKSLSGTALAELGIPVSLKGDYDSQVIQIKKIDDA